MKTRRWLALGILVLLALGLKYAPVDQDYLGGETGKRLWTEIEPEIKRFIPQGEPVRFDVGESSALTDAIVALGAASLGHSTGAENRLLISTGTSGLKKNLRILWQVHDGQEWIPKHVFTSEVIRVGWWSLVPALFVIIAALLFGKIIISLLIGIIIGGTILVNGNPVLGLYEGLIEHTLFLLKEPFRWQQLIFASLIMGMSALINRMGGMKGLVNLAARFAKTVRSTQLATMFSGICLFFDDYASCLIVGPTARSLTDKLKISRAKLAFIIDSTAAPIACIAIISTWIAYEIGLIQDLLGFIGVERNAYDLFVQSVPYRFYSIMMLGFVFLVAVTGRDFGPMLKAERAARKGDVGSGSGSAPLPKAYEMKPGVPARWYNGVIPIGVLIFGVFAGCFFSGGGAGMLTGEIPWSLRSLAAAVSASETSKVLVFSTLAAIIVATLLGVTQRIVTLQEALLAVLKGCRAVLFAIFIWVLAWGIGNICQDLFTAHYLVALLKDHISPATLTVSIFLISAGIGFVTGTSWGAMAILIPTSLPLTYEVGGLPLLIISLGAVLDGSIFGDHCSPISDTTIMSSLASSCDHLTHVRTQLPYAVLCMTAATLFGYLLAPQGIQPWICIPVGIGALFLILRFFGRSADAEVKEDSLVPPVPEEVPA
ncbi:Na+/H+ antiporter NhaC family protein [Bdellovibrionota bacterium]